MVGWCDRAGGNVQVTLQGKTAIVTGAASGIGLATVLKFLEAEAAGVVAVDRAAEPPEALSGGISAGRVRYVRDDVALERTAIESVSAAMDWMGRIDVLVN